MQPCHFLSMYILLVIKTNANFEKGSSQRLTVSGAVNKSPRPSARDSVRHSARFYRFSSSSSNSSMATESERCFAERIIKKRLSDSFIHSSETANSSCVSHHGQRLSQTIIVLSFGGLLVDV